MTYVVTESCIRCKYTDCVDVCPVDCFREGPNFLVIDPDECIDCTLCVAECPVEAIFAEDDVPADQQQFTALNAELAKVVEADHRAQARAAGRRRVEGRARTSCKLPRALSVAGRAGRPALGAKPGAHHLSCPGLTAAAPTAPRIAELLPDRAPAPVPRLHSTHDG